MKTFKHILLVVGVLLVLADVSWRILIWRSEAPYRAQFKFGHFYTNGVACLGIEEAKTGKPVLIDWDFGDGEKPGEVSYFFTVPIYWTFISRRTRHHDTDLFFMAPERARCGG